MPTTPEKAVTAFRTISEVAADVGVPQHVLRFWETRFPQVAPLKRGGNRRYYRPADVTLLHTINRLLYREGYTIKGVQQLLAKRSPETAARVVPAGPSQLPSLPAIRAQLAAALAAARALS